MRTHVPAEPSDFLRGLGGGATVAMGAMVLGALTASVPMFALMLVAGAAALLANRRVKPWRIAGLAAGAATTVYLTVTAARVVRAYVDNLDIRFG